MSHSPAFLSSVQLLSSSRKCPVHLHRLSPFNPLVALRAGVARGSKSTTFEKRTSTVGPMTARSKMQRLRLMENASRKKKARRNRQLPLPRALRGKEASSSHGNSHESYSSRTPPFQTAQQRRDSRIHLHQILHLRCDPERCLW